MSDVNDFRVLFGRYRHISSTNCWVNPSMHPVSSKRKVGRNYYSYSGHLQAVFIQVTERRPLKSLLPAVKTSCWKQLSCHPKQKYFRGGTSLPQNFGLDSSTLLIEKRVQVKIGLSHSKRLYYRYKEYFCSLSWHKSLGDISLFHNRSTFFQKPWRGTGPKKTFRHEDNEEEKSKAVDKVKFITIQLSEFGQFLINCLGYYILPFIICRCSTCHFYFFGWRLLAPIMCGINATNI